MFRVKLRYTEAVSQRCSVKKVFLEISQTSQENTCARVSILIKLQATYFYRTPLVAASGNNNPPMLYQVTDLKKFIKCTRKHLP